MSAGHGVVDPGNGWVSRVFSWIEETFPGPKHRLLNRAIPATTSGYVSACVRELLPETTDLIILEYTYNDYVFGAGSKTVNNPSRQVFFPFQGIHRHASDQDCHKHCAVHHSLLAFHVLRQRLLRHKLCLLCSTCLLQPKPFACSHIACKKGCRNEHAAIN